MLDFFVLCSKMYVSQDAKIVKEKIECLLILLRA